MFGGLYGNWGLFLIIYAGLIALAIGAHVVWVRRSARDVWRSSHPAASKVALTILLIVTPVVGFYATLVMRRLRPPLHGARFGKGDLAMPAAAAFTLLACALSQTMNYAPDFRTWQTLLGLVPGFLAFYAAMQSIVYMASSVFGLSQRGFLSSRTHLLSESILLAAGVVIR